MDTYEKKYKEIVGKVRKAYLYAQTDSTKAVLKEIFPELAESNDEKIRKVLIKFFSMGAKNNLHTDGIADKDIIAWLENQGEKHSDPYNGISFEYNGHIWGMCARDNGVDISCDKHLIKHLEKQAEVKESTISQHENRTCEENGNSLTYEDERIRKEIINYFQCQSEEEPTRKEIHNKWIAWLENVPVTIDHEKREGFHLGYKACLEKQGEQKPVEENKGNVGGISSNWSEEDEEYNGEDYGIDSLYHAQRILEKTLGSVEGYQSDDGILEHKCAISAVKKLYEQNPAWSEEDKGIIEEVVSYLINYSNIVESKEDADRIEYLIDKIQDICPHQKQEWSEEDSQYIDDAFTLIGFGLSTHTTGEVQEWLLSLKGRVKPQWKPSDEQMMALLYHCSNGSVLSSLYNDLNKLKEG